MNTIRHNKRLDDMKQREILSLDPAMAAMTTRLDFTYTGWTCWRNMFGEWGAILSRKGEQPIIINRCATKEELIARIGEYYN